MFTYCGNGNGNGDDENGTGIAGQGGNRDKLLSPCRSLLYTYCKAELPWMACYTARWFTSAQTVPIPIQTGTRRTAATLIGTNSLTDKCY